MAETWGRNVQGEFRHLFISERKEAIKYYSVHMYSSSSHVVENQLEKAFPTVENKEI
jgi:hypothetical protein